MTPEHSSQPSSAPGDIFATTHWTVVLAADWLIIRRVWRAVSRPLENFLNAQTKPTPNPERNNPMTPKIKENIIIALSILFIIACGIAAWFYFLKPKLHDGVVACWAFEGNGQDSIGHHDLTPEANANSTYGDGKVGQALGQAGNVSAFQPAEVAGIDFTKDFTLSVWLYRERSIYDNDAVFDNGTIYLAKRDASPWNSRMGVFLNLTDNRSIDLVDNSGMGQPPLHTWFHVLVFRHGNMVGIKVNNQGTATVDVSNMRLKTTSTMYVGRQRYGYPWQGRLDELCLWNRALSADEIKQIYDAGR